MLDRARHSAVFALASLIWSSTLSAAVADPAAGVFARVRAHGLVRCAGIIRPGIAVPTADGSRWYGVAPDICRAIAAAVLGDATRFSFRPYFGTNPTVRVPDEPDDVTFLSGAQLVGTSAPEAEPLFLGPVIVHDSIGLLVPASGVHHVAQLSGKSICVEPGSASDRALVRFFAGRGYVLREHPFQETDEMRQAYGDGQCAAVAGPLTTLASVRADPGEGHPADRILPERLADDPIFAATGDDARWARAVRWMFSALVNASAHDATLPGLGDEGAIPGVPPAVGDALQLPAGWGRALLRAAGSYAQIYDRNLGDRSPFRIERGANDSRRNGGSLDALFVE